MFVFKKRSLKLEVNLKQISQLNALKVWAYTHLHLNPKLSKKIPQV